VRNCVKCLRNFAFWQLCHISGEFRESLAVVFARSPRVVISSIGSIPQASFVGGEGRMAQDRGICEVYGMAGV